MLAEDPGYDPNRDAGDTARRSTGTRKADPLAYLVGPVKVAYWHEADHGESCRPGAIHRSQGESHSQ